ncbi:hypothetical protein Aduo_008730 [Ancylostoma duodenale]
MTVPISYPKGTWKALSRPIPRNKRGKQRKKDVLVFRIPDTNDSYVFCLARRNKSCDVYQCTGCKKMGAWKTVKVVGDDFMVDPCSIGHECTPVEFGRDKGNRIAYSIVNDIGANPMYAGRPPRQMFEQKLDESDLLYGEDIAMGLYASGYEQRRQAISRAINSLKDRAVTLENIPEELSFLRDGTRFVQEQDPELHIYYSERTIEKACTNGLFALVADGVHNKQPKSLTQFYCVHGVCDGGVEVPLLYALTARKTEGTYRRIFGHLQAILEGYRPRPHQRLRCNDVLFIYPKHGTGGETVVDYESSSKAPQRSKRWKSGGTPSKVSFSFLHISDRMLRLLYNHPPVPEDHPAHRGCSEFLSYLHSTWFSGLFADLWCKWELMDLRTTNLAEAYHSKLNTSFSTDHPDVRTLLEKLRTFDLEARCALQLLENNPEHCKRLRKRDLERREKVEESMTRFATLYRNRGATRTDIEKYCINMSKFISGETV